MLVMRENGRITRRVGRANFIMLMEMFLMESGKMIKQTDLEFMCIKMDLDMRGIGEMISNMEWAMKSGVMDRSMLECIRMERRVVMGGISGLTDLIMKVSGLIIK